MVVNVGGRSSVRSVLRRRGRLLRLRRESVGMGVYRSGACIDDGVRSCMIVLVKIGVPTKRDSGRRKGSLRGLLAYVVQELYNLQNQLYTTTNC